MSHFGNKRGFLKLDVCNVSKVCIAIINTETPFQQFKIIIKEIGIIKTLNGFSNPDDIFFFESKNLS
jgi:hypothetical protein